jgi:DNA adenine methylase
VKWAGGKRSILRDLLHYVPPRLTNYHEPFLGGGALYLGICEQTSRFTAFLSDTNKDLINAYLVIKDRPEELISSLSILQREYYASSNKKEYYYEKRSWQPHHPVESAARLIFLNKTCFNGLYRVNSKGQFNVPFGDYKRPMIANSEGIRSLSETLRATNAQIRCVDYREAVVSCKQGDFIYFDPPYNPTSKTSSFTDYTPNGFSEDDQRELATIFSGLAKRGCHVLLSNSDTLLIRGLYRDFPLRSIQVSRPINSVGSGRKGFKELIVSAPLSRCFSRQD